MIPRLEALLTYGSVLAEAVHCVVRYAAKRKDSKTPLLRLPNGALDFGESH